MTSLATICSLYFVISGRNSLNYDVNYWPKCDNYDGIRAFFPSKLWRDESLFKVIIFTKRTFILQMKQYWREEKIGKGLQSVGELSDVGNRRISFSQLARRISFSWAATGELLHRHWVSFKQGTGFCKGTGLLLNRCHHAGLRKDKALKTL